VQGGTGRDRCSVTPALVCIDTKSGVLTRYAGRRATHQPCAFTGDTPLNASADCLAGIEWLRMRPDELGVTKREENP
jgi:hypothetical protein